MNTNTQTTSALSFDGNAALDRAIALAGKSSAEMGATLIRVAKAGEDFKGGAFPVMYRIMADYGEDILGFPVPGNPDGNNPEVFEVESEDGNGKRTTRKVSWYVQFADATETGKAIAQRLEMLNRAGKANMVQDGISDDIKAMNPHQRKTEENFLNGRRGIIRSSIKKAMGLFWQLEAVNALQGGVKAEPIFIDGKSETDANEGKCEMPEVENTTKPIAVWQVPADGKPIKDWEAYSVSNFMKLNVLQAKEHGGTFKALQATITREKAGATGNNAKATEAPAIATVDTFVGRMVDAHRYLDEIFSAKDREQYAKLLKVVNAKGSDDFVTTLVESRNMLDDIIKATNANHRYAKLQEAGSELVTPRKDNDMAA